MFSCFLWIYVWKLLWIRGCSESPVAEAYERYDGRPLVGRLNAVFVIAIGFGMFIILICMVFNIINSIRNKNIEKPGLTAMLLPVLYFTDLSY